MTNYMIIKFFLPMIFKNEPHKQDLNPSIYSILNHPTSHIYSTTSACQSGPANHVKVYVVLQPYTWDPGTKHPEPTLINEPAWQQQYPGSFSVSTACMGCPAPSLGTTRYNGSKQRNIVYSSNKLCPPDAKLSEGWLPGLHIPLFQQYLVTPHYPSTWKDTGVHNIFEAVEPGILSATSVFL